MPFIEPLNLETWFVNVLSGTPEIFLAVALIFIVGMCGFFRMTTLAMFFIVGLFLLMMSGFIETSLILLMSIIGALIIGLTISKVLSRTG